jgi:hypothetical protein
MKQTVRPTDGKDLRNGSQSSHQKSGRKRLTRNLRRTDFTGGQPLSYSAAAAQTLNKAARTKEER